jgi:hypothetical protein
VGNYLEDSSERVTTLEDFVDFIFHAPFSFFVSTIQQDLILIVESLNVFPWDFLLHGNFADGNDVAENVDTEGAQKSFGDRADSDACRRFAGGGTFQDIAGLREIVFQGTRKVGMPRPRRGYSLVPRWVTFADRQGVLPISPIFIFQLDGDGRAYGHTLAHAREDVRRVTLNLHTAAAAIALLPAPEFTVEEVLIHSEPSGQTREEGDQGFAVRFSGCEVAQHKCSILPDAVRRRRLRMEKEVTVFGPLAGKAL